MYKYMNQLYNTILTIIYQFKIFIKKKAMMSDDYNLLLISMFLIEQKLNMKPKQPIFFGLIQFNAGCLCINYYYRIKKNEYFDLD